MIHQEKLRLYLADKDVTWTSEGPFQAARWIDIEGAPHALIVLAGEPLSASQVVDAHLWARAHGVERATIAHEGAPTRVALRTAARFELALVDVAALLGPEAAPAPVEAPAEPVAIEAQEPAQPEVEPEIEAEVEPIVAELEPVVAASPEVVHIPVEEEPAPVVAPTPEADAVVDPVEPWEPEEDLLVAVVAEAPAAVEEVPLLPQPEPIAGLLAPPSDLDDAVVVQPLVEAALEAAPEVVVPVAAEPEPVLLLPESSFFRATQRPAVPDPFDAIERLPRVDLALRPAVEPEFPVPHARFFFALERRTLPRHEPVVALPESESFFETLERGAFAEPVVAPPPFPEVPEAFFDGIEAVRMPTFPDVAEGLLDALDAEYELPALEAPEPVAVPEPWPPVFAEAPVEAALEPPVEVPAVEAPEPVVALPEREPAVEAEAEPITFDTPWPVDEDVAEAPAPEPAPPVFSTPWPELDQVAEAAPAPAPEVEAMPWPVEPEPAPVAADAVEEVPRLPWTAEPVAADIASPIPWDRMAQAQAQTEAVEAEEEAEYEVLSPTLQPPRAYQDHPTVTPMLASAQNNWGLPWPRPVAQTDGLSIADPGIWRASQRIEAVREDLNRMGAPSFGASVTTGEGSTWLRKLQGNSL